jgi:beta-alanine degradation protein BauB
MIGENTAIWFSRINETVLGSVPGESAQSVIATMRHLERGAPLREASPTIVCHFGPPDHVATTFGFTATQCDSLFPDGLPGVDCAVPTDEVLVQEANMRYWLLALAAVTGLALASPVAAQDPLKSNPEVYKLVFENASVRVLRVTVKPGAKTTLHEHPDTVIVALSNARVRFTGADGKAVEAALKIDQAMWAPAEKHSGENLEKAPAEVILVELKGAKPPTASIPTNRPDMKITPFFDNPRVMAYKAVTGPNFHEPAGTTHDFDQVVISLQESNAISVNVEGKAKNQWNRGDVLFIGRGMKHESKNTSAKPLDVIVVAIK